MKRIINHHKGEIDETADTIEELRDQYRQESYLPETEDIEAEELGSRIEETPEDTNMFSLKERELTMQKNIMAVSENSFKKVSEILNDSCSIVSKIMYQLEPIDVPPKLT